MRVVRIVRRKWRRMWYRTVLVGFGRERVAERRATGERLKRTVCGDGVAECGVVVLILWYDGGGDEVVMAEGNETDWGKVFGERQ